MKSLRGSSCRFVDEKEYRGTKYGIPFPVFARASYGVIGSNLPALMRAIVACSWFGIQAWIGGETLLGTHHYPNARAGYVVHTRGFLKSDCGLRLKERLDSFGDDMEARRRRPEQSGVKVMRMQDVRAFADHPAAQPHQLFRRPGVVKTRQRELRRAREYRRHLMVMWAFESQRRQTHVEAPAVNPLEQLHRLSLGAAHLEAGDQVKNSRLLCLLPRPGKPHIRNVQ